MEKIVNLIRFGIGLFVLYFVGKALLEVFWG